MKIFKTFKFSPFIILNMKQKICKNRKLLKRLKLSKKMRNLILVESILMTLIFGFIMYCQFFMAMNTFFDSLKVAFTFIIPLIIYAVPTGISYMIRGQIFLGEYTEALDDGQPKNLTFSGERLAYGH